MNKLSRKLMIGRETKYVPYKSYRNNDADSKQRKIQQQQSEEGIKSSEPSSTNKVKKSSKQKSKSVERVEVSAYRGDSAVQCANSGTSLKSILKHSESQTLDGSFQVYEKLKHDLALLQEEKCKLDEEIVQLKTNNEDLRNDYNKLRLSNEELRDQYELNCDQVKELLSSNEKKEEHLRQVESTISDFQKDRDAANSRLQELESTNRELENSNKELLNLVSELHSVSEEKDRMFDRLTSVRKAKENSSDKAARRKNKEDLAAVRVADGSANVTPSETIKVTILRRTDGEPKLLKNELQPAKMRRRTANNKVKETKHSTMFDCEATSISSTNSRKDARSSSASLIYNATTTSHQKNEIEDNESKRSKNKN